MVFCINFYFELEVVFYGIILAYKRKKGFILSELILKIYQSIRRGDEISLDASKYKVYQLKKIASMIGTNKGSMKLTNSNKLSKLDLNYLSNMSKKKIVFEI